MTRRSLRRHFLTVHLYFGIVLGSLFALIGLTGSFLVFYPEIQKALNPKLAISSNEIPEIRYQQVFEQLRHQYPQRAGKWRIEAPRSAQQPLFARYLKPEEKDPSRFAPLVVALDPSTLEILHSSFWGDDLVTWVYDLHYSLLLGPAGKRVVSGLGLALFLVLVLGLYLWWPRGRNRLQKSLPKIRDGSIKGTYDLHTYSGAYGFLLLAVLIVTGIGLATPEWVAPVIAPVSARAPVPVIESSPPESEAVRIGADRAIAIALTRFPNARLRWVEAPASAMDTYFLRLKQDGEPSDRFPKTYIWIDQFSGEVLAVRDPMHVPAADVFFDWLHPLHNGEAFGQGGRIAALLFGLLPAFLFFTGLRRWRQKQGSAHRSR
ncbi:MAG: hypothetical protein RL404_1076 [Pseudomonadota bacterium]|jgi:uncharacterized iron-regulated membrane protein